MALSVTYTNFDGELVYENRNGTQSFYAPDTLGSTAMLLSTTGTVTDTYTYWPYGEIQNHTGSSTTPFTFVGTLGYYLDLLGSLIYVRARHLRQALARWQTVDPLWRFTHAYRYVDNQPVSFTDASGLWHWLCDHKAQPKLCNWFWNNLPYTTDPRIQSALGCMDNTGATCNMPNRFGSDPISALNQLMNPSGGDANFSVDYQGNSSLCNGKCAWTDITARPPTIHICARGILGPGCPSPVCLIMHEILHLPGMTHNSENDKDFACMDAAFGCDTTSVSEHVG